MSNVVDMEEARKRLRPEEDDCILLFDELTPDPEVVAAIAAMVEKLRDMNKRFEEMCNGIEDTQ